ncbi:MAG: hypothetical protein RL712_1530 [Bacteroidota bacterium]
MNTNQYETVIILTPVLSEQQMKDAVAGYREPTLSRKKARDFITCLNLLLTQSSSSLSNWLSAVMSAFCVTSP